MQKLLSKVCLALILFGCATKRVSRHGGVSPAKLTDHVVLAEPGLVRFETAGPFEVKSRLDREFSLDLENTVVVDHFFAKSPEKLPVIIVSHGNFSNKRAHRQQARHLASWGFHVVSVESPNRDQWIENGARLRKIAEIFYRFPKTLAKNADTSKIIMIGHSFGGSAALLAVGGGAPVIGAILLDPAVVHSKVIRAMKEASIPVALLGSDEHVFRARGRKQFFRNISGEILEVSVPDSTHDDAQGPSVFSQAALGFDPFTSREKQALFRSMITVSVIGISSSGTLDFPMKIFSRAVARGVLDDFRYRDEF